MAAAGNVTGQIEEIDQAFEWLWYKIKNTGKSIVSTDLKRNQMNRF